MRGCGCGSMGAGGDQCGSGRGDRSGACLESRPLTFEMCVHPCHLRRPRDVRDELQAGLGLWRNGLQAGAADWQQALARALARWRGRAAWCWGHRGPSWCSQMVFTDGVHRGHRGPSELLASRTCASAWPSARRAASSLLSLSSSLTTISQKPLLVSARRGG